MQRSLRRFTSLAAVSVACGLAVASCTTGATAPDAPSSTAPAAGASGEVGAPIFEAAQRGRYAYLTSEHSYEFSTLQPDEIRSPGVLTRLQGPSGAPAIVSLDAGARSRLRLQQGWTIEPLAEEVTWNPITCAAVPHAVLGDRWIVMLRDKRFAANAVETSYDPTEHGIEAFVEIYDVQAKRFLLSSASHRPTDSVFTNTLRVEGPTSVSFLWGDGPVSSVASIPYINRRTIDLSTSAFVDETIDIGGSTRMVFAASVGRGYVVDLERPKTESKGVFATLDAAAGGAGLPLKLVPRPSEAPHPVAVSGAPGALKLTGQKAVNLPADFERAAIVAIRDNRVYLSYKSKLTAAISSEGLAVVDLASGQIGLAFDHTGSAAGVTGPPVATAPWANGASRLVVLGVV